MFALTRSEHSLTLTFSSPIFPHVYILAKSKNRGVLVLLKFWYFSPESAETWSLGAAESEVWIGCFSVKAWKTTEHKLHKIWPSLKFCKNSLKNEHTPGTPANMFKLIHYETYTVSKLAVGMLLEYFLLDLFQLFLMHVLHLRRKGFLFYDDVIRALVVLLCPMIPLGCARFPEILQNFSERQILWSFVLGNFSCFCIEITYSNFTFCGI